MAQGALHQGLGGRPAILIQQRFFQGSRVYPDAHRGVVGPQTVGQALHLPLSPQVARIDPHFGYARLQGGHRHVYVEMDVGAQGHRAARYQLGQGPGRGLIVYRHPHQLAARLGQGMNLPQGGLHLAGGGIGHRLYADRRTAPYGQGASHHSFGHPWFPLFRPPTG